MVTAQIAYNHLEPNVKAQCDSLLAVALGSFRSNSSSNFITAACWADDFKGQLGTSGWHYIDLPFSLDGTSTNGFTYPAQSNVVYAINLCITNLLNTATSQSNQAVCLRYLIHFVGDIEQPLHSSDAISTVNPGGDNGGNWFYLSGGGNLHSLWDGGVGYLNDSVLRPLSDAAQTIISNKAASIEVDYPYTPNPGSIPEPMDWAKEGWGLAQTVTYVGITRNATPSAAYTNRAQATVEQRMAAGGHRLADLLNTLRGTNAVRLVSSPAPNNTLVLSWSAIPGRSYREQWKELFSDAAAWTDLTNLTATSNSLSITDQLTSNQRFYRLVQ
jgi:hypothetical protein